MDQETFLGLVQNAALLLAIAVVFDIASTGRDADKTFVHKILLGIVVGGIGLIVMLTPLQLKPGIVFDTRSILLGISGLVFGLVPTATAMVVTASLRLYQGGAGTWTGVSVIFVTGIIGIFWHMLRRKPIETITWPELYCFGLVIHIAMLLLMFTLPRGTALRVLSDISIPVMLIYPFGTSLLGLLIVNRMRREQMNEALTESEERFRTLFEHMAEGVALHEIVVKDSIPVDYRFIDINPAYETLIGMSKTYVKGSSACKLFNSFEPPFFEIYKKAAFTGEPQFFETYFDTTERYVTISAVSPKRGMFATVLEDVTERKSKQKELEQKNEELERFTYTVSHDLKSPLITIKGFAGSLLADIDNGRYERFEEDLLRISDAADKMGELLDDLLELSRIGRIVNASSKIDMFALVREVIQLLDGPIKERRVDVTVISDLPAVWGDRQRIREVLQNLLENAIKFMGKQSSPKVTIGSKRETDSTIFFIQDNGIGIERRYHETIFGLFNKLVQNGEGTGVGLSLARRIIEHHHGRIWVESEGTGCGTTFYFSLPKEDS